MWYYYYNPASGEFTMRTSSKYAFTDDPYIQLPQTVNMANHRVDLATLEAVKKN